MEFYMTEERELIREAARDFAMREVAPQAEHIDRDDAYPLELMKRCGELGFMGIDVPEEYGGTGMSITDFAIICEEIGRKSGTLVATLMAHAGLAAPTLNLLGTPEQKQRWLIPLVQGEKIGALSKTEPSGNADNTLWTCRAVQDGDDWVINGTKVFCTNMSIADIYIVQAITDGPDPQTGAMEVTYFLVEKGTPGLEMGEVEDKLGWRGSNTGTVYYNDVRVPADHLIGKRGDAATCLVPTLYEMCVSGAASLGTASEAFDKAMNFALNRIHGNGTPYFFLYETMRTRLAAMYADIEALRSYTYSLCSDMESGDVDFAKAVLIKPWAYHTAEMVCSQAIDLHGGVGISVGTGAERLWRDAKVGLVGGGQYDILLDKAGMALGKTYGARGAR